jgi:RHS repeat-associated protein
MVMLYRHNPLLETDPNSIVEQNTYDAYGNVSIDDTDNWYNGNRYMFTGRRYDAESGLYYYRARMYNPGLGVFQSQDPLGYIDSMNLYAYCANNPLSYTDPWGLWTVNLTGGLGMAANINFGYNSGKWHFGGNIGVGFGISGNLDLSDSGPSHTGLAVTATMFLSAGNPVVGTEVGICADSSKCIQEDVGGFYGSVDLLVVHAKASSNKGSGISKRLPFIFGRRNIQAGISSFGGAGVKYVW